MHIGVSDAERNRPQPIDITLSFVYKSERAQVSDDICDAIDYVAIRQCIIQTLHAAPVRLLEHALYKLMQALAVYNLADLRIMLDKPEAFDDVASVQVTAL